MVIDVHTHILDEKTYKEYKTKAEGKITKTLIMPSPEKESIEPGLKFDQKHEELFFIGMIFMDKDIYPQIERHEELFKAKKIYGIKLCPGYEYFYPSDEKVYPIAQLCQKYNKPLIFHSGDTASFIPNAMLKYINPIYIDELAVKFPDLKIVISHFGFPYFHETQMIVSKNKNVYTDISGIIDTGGKNIINRFAEDLKAVYDYYPGIKKKTMFATDFLGGKTDLNTVKEYFDLVDKVFSNGEKENVFYKTAEHVYFEESKQ